MSECGETFEQLSAYADGELGGEEAEALEEHLESCESCRSKLETLKATKHRVATLGARREPTDSVRRQIEREARDVRYEQDERPWYRRASAWRGLLSPRARGWRTVAVALVAGGLVVAGYMFGISSSRDVPEDWAETFVADHMHSKPAAKPMDVAGQDRDEIVRYFEGKVGFAPVVPEVPGVELVGGRLCKLAGHHVELLLYRHDGQILSLFVSDALEVPATCRQSSGHGVCVRRDGELSYLLVGRLPSVKLRRLLEGALG